MTQELNITLTVKEIAVMTGGKLIGDGEMMITSITTDSREVKNNSLFVAIKGERFDGHDYVKQCIDGKLACAVVDRIPESTENCTLVVVEDTVTALGDIAREYKTKFSPITVAVTGSIGKTTTKEFISAVLSEKFCTHKTDGNYNNNIGLPMSVLGLTSEHNAAVFEMGMSAFGEIDYLTHIVCPNIAVITNIGTSHIEHLGSREGIRDAKMEIVNGLTPGGVLVLNGDEPLLEDIKGAVYVGMKNRMSDVFIDNIVFGENGSAFDLTIRGERIESIVIPAIGEHNIMNAAIAYTVGTLAGMGEFEIRRGLRNYQTTGMRQHIFTTDKFTIIEDCYNAAPESMLASIKVLAEIANTRKLRPVAVLGEMRELGAYSKQAHESVGESVAKYGVQMLVTFGHDATVIANAAKNCGMNPDNIFVFEDISSPDKVADCLLQNCKKDDILLFKASRAIALERVIEKIK